MSDRHATLGEVADQSAHTGGAIMTQLREARADRGWSQSRLIHALRSQAAAEGLNLPAGESMRILLSRWENGHAVPDATYRRLLGAVLLRRPAELGFRNLSR